MDRSKSSQTLSKVQEAYSILRMGFAPSNWPHLHGVYIVTLYRVLITAVSS